MRGIGYFPLFASLALGFLGSAIPARAATSLSQYGITWFFSADRPVGQFANGDWWVVGPVTITNITPKTGDGGVSYSHGSMLNPIPGETQGLYLNGPDSNPENRPKYDAAKNISLRLPITVAAGNSVYSTLNNPDTWKGRVNDQGYYQLDPDAEKTWFKETAVLTVLGSAPPVGSFRPPYAGSDKTIKANWNVASLNYSVLRSLAIPVPANAPSLTWLEEATRRPLLEMDVHFLNSNWKAAWAEYKPGGFPRRTYGREVSHIASGAGLMLNTNLTNAQKQKLAIHMVQWGIDTYGLLLNGMQWQGSGGHQNGRLLPIYIAAKMLNDSQIMGQVTGNSRFQEVATHFFVDQAVINLPRSNSVPPPQPYTAANLGMPEWCGGSKMDPQNSLAWTQGQYYASGYRFINGAPNCGTIATILLMGGRAEINHEPLFGYIIDRYYPAQRPTGNGAFSGDGNGVQPFVRDMWDVHISGGTPPPYVPPVDPPVDPPPVNPTFAIGDRVQVWTQALVCSSATTSAPVGNQNPPNLGTIVEGPVGPDAQDITWYRIDYDNGVDGWSRKADIIKSLAPPASTFAVGDRIKVWRTTWANSTAAITNPIASQPTEAAGVLVEGPVSNGADNIVWFRVNYDTGVDGWSGADNFIKLSSGNPPTPPTGFGVVVDPNGNWSFEDPVNPASWSFENPVNLPGWTITGHYEMCTSVPTRFATDGLRLVAFNSGNFSPNAVLSKTVATTAGKTYVLNYKVGVQAYNQNSQTLRAKAIGTAPLAEVSTSMNGDGSGISRWQNGTTLTFVANGPSTVIEFKDVSSATEFCDLLLDEVVLVVLE